MPVKRRAALLVLALILSLSCLGMGSLGGTDMVHRIPVPDRDFTVTITDSEDVSFTATSFTVAGLTYAPATLGRAEMGIDFADIRDVFLHREGQDNLAAKVVYRNGDTRELFMSPDVTFFGKTPWGLMRLAAKDIREIHFQ